MAIIPIGNQYKYDKRGPFDAKALVKTYANLLDPETWTVNGTMAAYNGMLTAVWLNKDDSSKNGIYFLFDPSVTSALAVPDVANESNWHKLTELSDVSDFNAKLAALENSLLSIQNSLSGIQDKLETLEKDDSISTYEYRSSFPKVGEVNVLYIALDEEKSYIWYQDNYFPISGSTGTYEEPKIIYGGSAD